RSRGSSFAYQQRKERPRLDPAEQQQVERHRRRQRSEDEPGRRALRDAALALGARRLQRVFVRQRSTFSTSRTLGPSTPGASGTSSTLGTVCEAFFSEPHENVLDEAADDRRVVADARDAEARAGGHSMQLGNVA